MTRTLFLLAALALGAGTLVACAETTTPTPATPTPAAPGGAAHAADAVPDAVTGTLDRVAPGAEPDSIRPAPLAGLWEVRYGAQIVYVSADGRYGFEGDVVDLTTLENLTGAARAEARLALLSGLEGETIDFAPAGGARHTVHVFTDVECPYCQRLHHEMERYNELGIEIRYLAFPRHGVESPGYGALVAVWCAEDRQAAMTRAKAGEDLPAADCDNPVRDHLALAADFDVSGTPTLVFSDGTTMPGYVPPDRLAAFLDRQTASR